MVVFEWIKHFLYHQDHLLSNKKSVSSETLNTLWEKKYIYMKKYDTNWHRTFLLVYYLTKRYNTYNIYYYLQSLVFD